MRSTFDLTQLRNGFSDPTTRVMFSSRAARATVRIERAALTPCGPGSILFEVGANDEITGHAWGEGADWLWERATKLAARHQRCVLSEEFFSHHRTVSQALRTSGLLHLPATESPYHEILPAILGQRITAAQAHAQWRRLCDTYGEAAPGPLNLRLPPTPERLKMIPSWEFHQLGIEEQRARTLHTAARYADYVDRTRDFSGPQAREALLKLPGIGVWTAAATVGISHGDPDALPVGDFHVKNTVAWALAGRARGTDEEMIELLHPYDGQRWRVVRMLESSGFSAPRYGPKRRLFDVARL
ncbi:MAG: hypothetical protein RL072_943 [Actinomycetota bacterium]|jgi:3-methyladenine DNA glycosylase/8-oxoguanine DNA glycosylase